MGLVRQRWFRISAIAFVLLSAVLTAQSLAVAQPESNDYPDFWLAVSFVRDLAEKNTILYTMQLSMDERSKRVHTLKDDCEIHIAASTPERLAKPPAVVVEPPNLCKERPPGTTTRVSETRLRNETWPRFLDRNVMGRECTVSGFPRIFTEHASGNADPANPNHVLEIHPAISIKCGENELNMRTFLKAHPGMRRVKDETAARCVEGRKLFVRRRTEWYELQQHGGGSCGNFAVFHTTIDAAWIRKISGGHSAIGRVSPGGLGPFTLKMYTFDGTKEDQLFRSLAQGATPRRRLYFHGMFTYDYFAIVRALRDPGGNWTDPRDWTEVRFPLALVIFGETNVQEAEE